MSSAKVRPNLDERNTKMLNLTVLKRIDPCIEEILKTAAHVSFYEFNVDLHQWSRKEVEGSLFVVKRNAQPRFQFIVMNRRSTENLVEDLLGDFEFEVQVPYLLYRNAVQEINGIWFYNTHESEEVAELFGRILGAYSKVPLKLQPRKSEYTEHETAPVSTIMEGPFESAFTTSTASNGAGDSSFMNFFNTAACIGHNSSIIDISPCVQRPLQFPAPSLQVSLPIQSTPSPSTQTRHDSANRIDNAYHGVNLVKPSFFTPPASPVLVTTSLARALYRPMSPRHSHGAPVVQPFPPPTPTPFLTSTQIPPNGGPPSREKVRDALLILVQDNQFLDLVYQALLKVHRPD